MNQSMKILITNDDGINAVGLISLVRFFADRGHHVTVVAPDSERSACGHAITVHHPLRVSKSQIAQVKSYAVNGTPADCVKLALDSLIEPPDMVLSGINRGPNLGTDVLYSGTVSAAIEAALESFPAIAVSIADYKAPNYEVCADYIIKIAESYHNHSLPSGTLLNVNIPNIPLNHIKGIKITKLGERKYLNNFEKRQDPRGGTYYWLAGVADESNPEEDTDVWAVKNSYVSVTPIHFDLTNHYFLEKLRDWNL